MGTISFKSVGRTRQQTLAETLATAVVPIGIKTPMRLGGQDGIYAMHSSLADQIHDNLRNLLLTNHGERLGLYDFGANLRPLTTELVNIEDFETAATQRIAAAVARWMPFVSLDSFLATVDRNENVNTAVIRIRVTYTVPSLQTALRALEITLYAI